MNQEGLTYLANMRTAQSRIHLGDIRWYVQSANGWVVRGPFDTRDEARAVLKKIREQAFEEHEEELRESA